jgi:hypothetical protein
MPLPAERSLAPALAGLALGAALLAGPAAAQSVDAERFALADILPGATAIAFAPPGTLFVSTPEAAYYCIYSILPDYLDAIAADRLAEVPRPEGTCVDLRVFDIHETR